MTNRMTLSSQRFIPIPEPEMVFGTADSGRYTVHPALAGPLSTKNEVINRVHDQKKNQYDSTLRKGRAMSRTPICNGSNRWQKVPPSTAVSTHTTPMVTYLVP